MNQSQLIKRMNKIKQSSMNMFNVKNKQKKESLILIESSNFLNLFIYLNCLNQNL